MKPFLKFLFLIGLLFVCVNNLFAQLTSRQERNLTAFTKLYGYVRFFHPSDEAQQINWYRFANYGSIKVINLKTDIELKDTLEELYRSFAPTIEIQLGQKQTNRVINAIRPSNFKDLKVISWQHLGVKLLADDRTSKSIRINRTLPGDPDSIYSEHLNIGEEITAELVPGIYCVVPLALYGDEKHTYPISDTVLLSQLNLKMSKGMIRDKAGNVIDSGNILGIRFCDVITNWNILKHFFPYWQDVSQTPDKILHFALNKAFMDKSPGDFLVTLKQMAANYNDGHMAVSLNYNEDVNNMASAPLVIGKIGEQLIVKFVTDSLLKTKIHPGDVIEKINNQTALDYLKTKENLISGSTQWKECKTLFTLTNGPFEGHILLDLKREEKYSKVMVNLTQAPVIYRPGNFSPVLPESGWLRPRIFYLNLDKDSLSGHLNDILKAKAVIIDVRGYPKQETTTLIAMLLKQKDTTNWAYFPKILYPDYQKVSYIKDGWHLNPDRVHINAKIIFLTDASAISAAESLMGYVKYFKLGTIIGEPTAGTNGNVNSIYLLGDFSSAFSGLLIKNLDGTKHHLKGIIPDIEVKQSKIDIINGKDTMLDKAIFLAQKTVDEK